MRPPRRFSPEQGPLLRALPPKLTRSQTETALGHHPISNPFDLGEHGMPGSLRKTTPLLRRTQSMPVLSHAGHARTLRLVAQIDPHIAQYVPPMPRDPGASDGSLWRVPSNAVDAYNDVSEASKRRRIALLLVSTLV